MIEPNAAPRSMIWSPMRWLVIGEILVFTVTAQITFSLHLPAETEVSIEVAMWQLSASFAFGFVMAAVLHALGMHSIRARHTSAQTFFKYTASAAVAAFLLWFMLTISAPGELVMGHVATGLASGYAVLLVWRVFVHMLIDSATMSRNVVVLGAGRGAKAFNDALRRRCDRRGLAIVGFIPVSGDRDAALEPGRLIHSRTSLAKLCTRMRVNEIVVASDDRRGGLPIKELLECRFHGIEITQAATFVERECGRIPIELVDPSWWLFRKGFNGGVAKAALKRSFDIFAGALILLLASPIMLLCALAIRIEGGAGSSILFRQVRVGRNGRNFRLFKFRSMREDAESDGVARWATTNDDRVTRIGGFLRKVRLDELPQLFNVLRGDMSLVGPRPERPEFVGELTRKIPYYEQRHVMRPGITGWAQLSYPYGASTRDALEKLKYDLYYIKNHSLAFDIAILLRTIEVVLFGKGAR